MKGIAGGKKVVDYLLSSKLRDMTLTPSMSSIDIGSKTPQNKSSTDWRSSITNKRKYS
jgi:hypothetical protein